MDDAQEYQAVVSECAWWLDEIVCYVDRASQKDDKVPVKVELNSTYAYRGDEGPADILRQSIFKERFTTWATYKWLV